jgi:polysaccharide pyruvyl transferase WcaK-like protein
MKKALLLGSFGQTNLGDDILMYNFIDRLLSDGIDFIYVNASITTNVPSEITFKYGSRIEIFETYSTPILKLMKLAKSVDYIYYGGGTIYKELYKSTGRSKYSVIIRLAVFNVISGIFMKKPIINLNIGTGKIDTKIGDLITKIALFASTKTLLRDEKSYVYVTEKLKISSAKAIESTDGIFINTTWEDSRVDKIDKNDKLTVGINLLSDIPDEINRDNYVQEVISFCQKLIDENFRLIFVPFQSDFNENNDYVFIKNKVTTGLTGNFEVLPSVKLSHLNSTFRSFDYFVGMRFHSLLLACINEIKFLAIEYDPKCTRLMEDMSYEYSINLNKINSSVLYDKFIDLTSSDDVVIKTKMHDYVRAQKDIIRKTLIVK